VTPVAGAALGRERFVAVQFAGEARSYGCRAKRQAAKKLNDSQ